MEKVSIIMPCYNDGLYIMDSIECVMKQTYTEWELIIIDDGSDDSRTIEVLKEINDPRIRCYRTERLRPAGARNFGISKATGKYILPLDSDDIIHETYIEKAVEVISKDLDIGVVYCKAELFGEKKGTWDLPDYSLEAMLLDNIVFVTALFYKADWERVGGFNTNMESGMEDYDFWLSILELEKAIYQIPEVLFFYRIKKISRTTKFLDNSEQVQETYRKIYYNHKKFYDKYAEEYALILRKALIEQIFIRRRWEYLFEKINKYSKIPILRWIINKIFSEEK